MYCVWKNYTRKDVSLYEGSLDDVAFLVQNFSNFLESLGVKMWEALEVWGKMCEAVGSLGENV